MFGFLITTCCGDMLQDNTFEAGWVDFFGKWRLLAILERSKKGREATSLQNGPDYTDDTSHLSNEISEILFHLVRLWSMSKGTYG
jgi:fructosamine-3-kinase